MSNVVLSGIQKAASRNRYVNVGCGLLAGRQHVRGAYRLRGTPLLGIDLAFTGTPVLLRAS